MSHDFHGAADAHSAPLGATGTITMGVKLLVVLGVLLSIMQGMFVGLSSGYGRVWPSEASTKIPLPPSSF
ncbi:MAG: hypothetical protein ABI186_00505 [Candidatus Elarobacter sp.]